MNSVNDCIIKIHQASEQVLELLPNVLAHERTDEELESLKNLMGDLDKWYKYIFQATMDSLVDRSVKQSREFHQSH